MPRYEIPQKWTTKATDRECGSCYACCVWLGVEELRKYTGQTCRHLAGTKDPSRRCSIYATRPTACSTYECMWRVGWGPAELRPHDSGILITPYLSERGAPGTWSATVNIFDAAKAEPYINEVIGELMGLPLMDELRLIYLVKKKAIMFRDGFIYGCRLLPAEGFESLVFEAHSPPLGRYEVQQIKEPT